MAGRWFRVYEEIVDDPKVQMLPDRTFRALINLWALASKNDGILPPIEEIAFSLRMKSEKVYDLLARLRTAGLLEDDETGNGNVRPHNWAGRQFKSDVSTERVKRHRKQRRNVSSTVSQSVPETPPETESDTETDREYAESPEKPNSRQTVNSEPNGSGAHAPPDPEKDLFDRGKQLLGKKSGGLIAKVLRAKNGNVALARAAIETASTKQNPSEFLGAIARGTGPPDDMFGEMKVGL